MAKEDPGYIWWIWHKIGPTMTDEMYYAVEDIMYGNNISFEKKATKKLPPSKEHPQKEET